MFSFNKEEITLDIDKMPQHIAIILDGNGRWAKKRMLPVQAGHKAGAQTLEKISNYAKTIGVKHLTVYAFSTENWKRSEEEVKGIMDLLRSYLKNYMNKAKTDDVKIDVIGDIHRLDKDIQEQIEELETLTKDKKGMNLHIALNYGGRDEICRAVKKLAQKIEAHEIKSEDISQEVIESFLDTANIPDPELLIRTSGEERISNFLLWQIAYSEFCFSEKFWPDFSEEDLKTAIYNYQNRDRRFGGRK